jgi:hypothetical protein
MTDQESTPAGGQEPAATKEGQEPKGEPTGTPETFDKEYVSKLRSEAADWRVKAQQAAERLEEREEADKSELEKAQGKVSKAEERARTAEAALLRFQVATEKQLPKELVPRLRGDTREELEADADDLLALVKSRTDENGKPDFDGGAREPAKDPKSPEDAHHEAILGLLGLAPPSTP